MGSGASLMDNVDQETFKTIAGEHYSEDIFNAFKNDDGFIPKDKVIALQTMMENTRNLRAKFNAALVVGLTTIDVVTLEALIKADGFEATPEDLLDLESNRKINFLEFMNIMIPKMSSEQLYKDIMEAFRVFDLNGDGFISVKELTEVMNDMGENVSELEARGMIGDADENGDGKLDVIEFSAQVGHSAK